MTKRTHILSDDVLIRILSKLSIKQLFRVQLVCRQFRDCANEALKRKTGIRIGNRFDNLECDDPKHSIVGGNVGKAVDKYYRRYAIFRDLVSSLDRFALVLQRCPNVRSLYLSECRITLPVIQSIVDNCKHLKCVALVANYCSSDMKEWKQITEHITKFNLEHLTVLGQAFHSIAGDGRHSESNVTSFARQIDHLVSHLPTLQKLILYWYSQSLVTLLKTLPQSIRSLHLIRCAKLSVDDIPRLRPEKLPNLKELKIDTNFYGRKREAPMFEAICDNLCLDTLTFFADCPLEHSSYCHLATSQLKNLWLKFYENEAEYQYVQMPSHLTNPHMRSVTIQNFLVEPQFIKQMAKCFPYLESLDIMGLQIKCVCDGDVTDGESYLIWGYVKTECNSCKMKAIRYLSRMTKLKFLYLYDSQFISMSIQFLNNIDELTFLSLTLFKPTHLGAFEIEMLSLACLDICYRRKVSESSLVLTVHSSQSLRDDLYKSINDITCGSIPINLRIN